MTQDWKDGFAAGWKAAMEAKETTRTTKPGDIAKAATVDPKSTPIAGGWI